MALRVTARWIRTFMNAHKQSSFQDKVKAMLAEPNPYYLLEWLVIEETEEDEPFWHAWEGDRTPGMEKGSFAGIKTCFREQLLLELLLGHAPTDADAARMGIAFADLESRYGEARWHSGLTLLIEKLVASTDRYKEYTGALKKETKRLENEAEGQRKELQEEAAQYEEGEFDLEAEERLLQAKIERKKQELPARVLQRQFPEDALLRYMAVRALQRPVERVNHAIERLRGSAAHPARQWAEALGRWDIAALIRFAADAPAVFSLWLATYMSRSELTRGWIPEEDRQRSAIRWISAAAEAAETAEEADRWLSAAFHAVGWEGRLAEESFADGPLHLFVWHALRDESLLKRLREEVILQHWELFKARLKEQEATAFRSLSWVFVLDPESIQQRMLRGEAGGSAEELIQKLCLLYAEGIRHGLDVNRIAALYAYLAKHDKESFYSFVHGAKTLEAALPIMEMPASELSQLFRGDGVRQAAARKHLLQLFYSFLAASPKSVLSAHEAGVLKIASILTADKRAAVVGWLQRHERDWRAVIAAEEGRLFTRLLRFRWIGTAEDETEQHRNVQEWLQRHSDWVQFSTDASNIGAQGVTYKIIKPGAIDADTGEVLARVTVRAEWTDGDEVGRLLDDLKLL